ncbi:MAG TPA: glycosyltransferase family 9 protein [Candidatus Eisenbacteria bacterium]|nr:glycosyltransferase family 9 protein [Candidatus Eisenbacteria bacterium]
MAAGPALVVRLSSLGDVLLAAHLPSLLRIAAPGRRVLFLTKERFAEVLRGHPDVDRFYMLEDGSSDPAAPSPLGVKGGAGDLRLPLRREGIEEIFDVQQNLRSDGATRALDRARRVAFEKHGLRRRLLVHARFLRPEPLPPLLHRYRTLAGVAPATPLRPWLRDALTDGERARASDRLAPLAGRGFVLIAPGARWATKRWPARHAARLGALVAEATGLAARYAVGPDDATTARDLAAQLPGGGAESILSLGIRDAAAVAARASAIVASDSALLHFGPALGVPAVGLFGSTIPGFGFASGEPRDAVAEVALPCRPCDVHGKDRCPLRHHACMERLEPSLVLEKLRPLLDAAGPTGRAAAPLRA